MKACLHSDGPDIAAARAKFRRRVSLAAAVFVLPSLCTWFSAGGARAAREQDPRPQASSQSSGETDTTGKAPSSGKEGKERATRPAVRRNKSSFPVSWGMDLTSSNNLAMRGMVIAPGTHLLPAPWVRAGNFTASNMSGLDMVHRPDHSQVLSFNMLSIDYSKEVSRFGLSGGWVNYFFGDARDTRHKDEFYFVLRHDSYLNPSFKVAQGIHGTQGSYWTASFSHAVALPREEYALIPQFSISYNRGFMIPVSTLSDMNFGLSLRMPFFSNRLSAEPFFTYSQSLRREILPNWVHGGLRFRLK